MNLLRLLLLAAIAWLVWRLLRGLRSAPDDPLPPPPSGDDGGGNEDGDPTRNFERKRACSVCGAEAPQVSLDTHGRCRDCAR